MPREQKQVRELQEGSYVMMDESPCEINSYSTAKPGKHGSAKARVEGNGVFDDRKRSLSQSHNRLMRRYGFQSLSASKDRLSQSPVLMHK
jgi:translation elongation factor P/translation initiation factor 5A